MTGEPAGRRQPACVVAHLDGVGDDVAAEMQRGGRAVDVAGADGEQVGDVKVDPDAGATTATELAIHTGYAPAASGLHAWGGPLYGLVDAALPTTLTFGPEAPAVPGTVTRLAGGAGS